MAKDYKKQGDITHFDRENKLEKLSKLGNPLARLANVMDFEMFRPELESLMSHPIQNRNEETNKIQAKSPPLDGKS